MHVLMALSRLMTWMDCCEKFDLVNFDHWVVVHQHFLWRIYGGRGQL